ncbi:GNAT family N-acetyltransferase [Pedobacter aquatilis]|uniref:GNAT family N-acetyltransferase n=1 Tax=Pedobacter aquatilis TaxID=351343 RepID=UPI002931D7B9|nr:GNAT family N-acetyltransferase [Pedobacter aquatilis]
MNNQLFKNIIARYGLRLRLIEPDDASFVLELRNDQTLSRFLSKTSNNLQDQVNWIKSYKEREMQGKEYYFIASDNDDKLLGTTRISELDGCCFELGSWLFSRDAQDGAAIIADIITREIGFDTLGFNCCKFNVRKENKSVLKYHLNFGPSIVDETDIDTFFKLDKENFNKNKYKFLKFYTNGN